jgi:phosphoserine phosphatase
VTGPFDRILNVIVPDGSGEAAAARARASLGACGETVWLSPGRAFDIPFTGDGTAARTALAQARCDVNIVPAARRRKKLLVADMDSTVIGCECLDELADMAGLKPRIAAITERAMRGEIGFEDALRERVAMLRGLPLDALERTFRERVRLDPGAKALVATMRRNGARALLVSGGFTYFTARVAAEAGFDDAQANTLLDDGARLTGQVGEPILGREAKRAALEREAAHLGLDLADTLAVGDGANDLDMIPSAGLGVAYRAKPVLADAAGARIDHGDLTALLYLQGYRDEEIVSPA